MRSRSVPLKPPIKGAKPPVKLAALESTAIHSTAHDAATGEVHVRFNSNPGVVYIYPGTAEEHDALRTAKSAGRHFRSNFAGREHRKVAA